MLERMVTVMEANERRIEITRNKRKILGFLLGKGKKERKKRNVWERSGLEASLYTQKGN